MHRPLALGAFLLAWLTWAAAPAPAAQRSATADTASLAAQIARDYDEHLGELFVHFHRNPELSFLEKQTAARLAAELRAAGADVTEGVGGTGVVGVLRNGTGPTVLIRADMDALPIEERSGLPYASTVRMTDITGEEVPVMHACGHDVHITSLVGVARRLAAMRDAWRGTVLLIGQPAEERGSGSRAMLDDGLYTRFPKPDFALALHVASLIPAGRIQVDPGLVSSSADSVDILVRGVGSHGASPHRGKDPIVLGAQIVLALQTLVSRELSPLEPGVVTVGAFHAGSKHNIIPDEARLQLTVRADRPETREKLLAGIERIAVNAGRMAGLPEDLLPQVKRLTEGTPPLYNDAALTARVRGAMARHFGDERLFTQPREGMGAEDFANFVAPELGVPGVYFRVGGTPPEAFEAEKAGGPPVAPHHSPLFKIEPRASVTTGVEAMVVAALELLGKP